MLSLSRSSMSHTLFWPLHCLAVRVVGSAQSQEYSEPRLDDVIPQAIDPITRALLSLSLRLQPQQ